MAKKTAQTATHADLVPAHVIENARKLLSSAEKRFFDSSFGAALAKATHEQVEAATKQARSLRNKWRDLHAEQSRDSKRKAQATPTVNTRTREKHDILAGVVARFEKRLGELKSYVTGTAPAKAAMSKPKKAKAGKSVAKKAAMPSKKAVAKKRSRS